MTISEEIIHKIEYFPQPAGAAYRLIGRLDSGNTSQEELLKLLEFDIPATSNILKLCNTPANMARFGFSGKISSIKTAVSKVGIGELKEMLTMTVSTDIFAGSSGSGYESGIGEMRRHSIAAAVISRHLLPYAPKLSHDLFTTCLLHDLGKLILSEFVSHHYADMRILIEEKAYDFSRAEKEVLGMTHAEAGARILEKWGYPDPMVSAVRFHHHPQTDKSPLTHFVALADAIAMMLGFTTGFDALDYMVFPGLYDTYKIKEKDIELIAMHAVDEINNAIPFRQADADESEDSIPEVI